MMESIQSSRPLTPKALSLRHGKQQSIRSRALTETARAAKAWNAEASLSQEALEEPSIQPSALRTDEQDVIFLQESLTSI